MRAFGYSRGQSLEDALAKLSAGHRALAGGTDLLPLLKADIEQVSHLVDIKPSGLPDGIGESGEGLRIGALCTLAEIAESQLLAERWPLLCQAAGLAATPQLRNRATLGGNLLQRPRCWYFRNPHLRCWLKGGRDCLAEEGCHERHAVFEAGPCRAVHPSDLAGCLLALDADVSLLRAGGTRSLALKDFFAPPEPARRRETVLGEDELLVHIDIPAREGEWRSVYLKAMDRRVWDFALAGIALVLHRREGRIESARVVANGLAPVPWRLRACEERLRGTRGEPAARAAAVAAVAEGAAPLPDSAWKLGLASSLLKRALDSLL